MKPKTLALLLPWLAAGVLGFAVGSRVMDRSAELEAVRTELSRTQQELETLKRLRSSNSPTGGRTSISRPLIAEAVLPPAEATASSNRLPHGITREDLAGAKAKDEAMRHGDYVLRFERPTLDKFRKAAQENIAAMVASNNAPTVGPLFASLGLDESKSQQLQAHLAKIAKAAVEAETSISQLQIARKDYDKRLRSVLSESDYANYRQQEATTYARREVDKIQSYAQSHGLMIEPAAQESLIGLIQQTKAYTEESWLGPYDGIPQPLIGQEALIQHGEEQLKPIKEGAALVNQWAAQAGLPEAQRSLLAAYYAQEIQNKQQAIETVRNPLSPQEMDARFRQKIAAWSAQRPSP